MPDAISQIGNGLGLARTGCPASMNGVDESGISKDIAPPNVTYKYLFCYC